MDDKQLEELMVQSFIKIMMETEKTAEGKAELAEAQARAEQRKNSNVQMQFGTNGLHINSEIPSDQNQVGQQPQMQPQLPYDQQQQAFQQQQQQIFQQTATPLDQQRELQLYQQQQQQLQQQQLQNNLPQQQQQPPPYYQQQELQMPPQQPVYGQQVGPYDGGGTQVAPYTTNPYSTNTYPSTTAYPTSLPEFKQNQIPAQGVPYQSDVNAYTNTQPLSTVQNYPSGEQVDPNDDPYGPNHPNRRRREGRDHTNYNLPPNLDPFKTNNAPNGAIGNVGPPGLPVLESGDYGDQENGLKLVVLDKTDDEDEDGMHRRYSARPNTDVYKVDKEAVDRDLYKQEYIPQVNTAHISTNDLLAENGPNPINHNPPVPITNAFGINNDQNVNQNGLDTPKNPSPTFAFNVTDFDSETGGETGRSLLGSQPQRQQQLPQQQMPMQIYNPNHHYPYFDPNHPTNDTSTAQQLALQQGQHPSATHTFQHPDNNGVPQQLYSMSLVDYERFTSNPSQLSTVREDLDDMETYRSEPIPQQFQGVDNRTFLIHPSAMQSNHHMNGAQRPEFKILGPGYKFQVNKENVVKRATRANILSRAEQLLDARRGQLTDRSDSSDELRRVNDGDDEDEDKFYDMTGPRHQALKHLRRRVYDDTTSYNSSDDVLNIMKLNPRGPVTQAARRARLTSVNARLNKQKRIRAARRQNLPPPPMSDDEINSSGSDAMEPPSSYRRHHVDISRYEESKLRDVSNEGNLRHNQLPAHIGDATPGAKGRRVLFFRNGDIHFKPRQVLINHKTYINLEKLLVDLSAMVETSTGVKHIFSWPEGREVKSITDFENGKYYVCSSTNKLQRVDYGNSKEGHWKGGKIDRRENFLFQHLTDGKVQSPLRRPRVLTIISNMYRDSREKLILNTNSQMNFEDILNDIVNMVNIPNPPVRALYTEKKPHLKVESYSQLIRDFADHDNFIACGEELLPLELSSKRSSFNPNGSVDGSKRGGRKNQRSDGSRVRGDHSVSPTRNSDVTTHNDKVNSRHQAKVRRRKTDSVRVDINGKTREFFPPTMLDEEDDGMKPDKKLRLDWVYGFRGRDVKQNLAVLPSSGELVYFVAAVVVVYDKKFATQKHYLGHSEEITCLTVHPNGRFVATGQTSGKTPDTGAHVRIWDGISLSTYAVVGLGTFQRGIACVNFSEKESQLLGGTDATSGDLLMAIDDSDRHVMTVWEWQTEKLVARTTTTTDPVVSGCFYPFDETILVTFGKEHIHFWTMFWEKGKKIMRDKLSGNFEDAVPKFVTSLCFSPTGDAITGDSSGAILIWSRDHNSVFSINENLSVQTRKAHKKSVSALCMLGDGTLLSGGGNEVKAWDSINSYSLVKERVLPESAGHVRSIVPINMGGLDGSIYVATTRNKILEGSLQLKFKFLIQGHVEELWAVESHPLEQTFVSAGHDQTVVKWSAVSHAPVWKVNVDNPCTSISIDPKGRLIALGTTAGKVVILNSYNGIQLTTLFSGNAQINALSFSPDAKMLAVGTFDGTIQIYYMQDEGHNFFRSQTAALKHSNMFIMHMDWSIDSRLLQTVLGDYDIVYWDVTTMQKIKAARTVRDVKWATHNCPIDHSIIGPWQNLERGEVINVVSRSQYRDLMVVGDSKGKLKLYKWPCSLPKSGFRNTKVYSSNVTCATFTCDDNFVITSGGNDAALMQFSVLDPVNAR